ncbi:VHL beta domain-containing protein [Ancylobacter terrae]|uniref:VHL beta domain-containing protein n=1 Tax=Ancylobacter sp. sgz301288 TaxID=3342077 RepID=UPI00385C7643
MPLPSYLRAGLLALVTGLGLTLPAAAQEETSYATLGRWSITLVKAGGQFGYCAADVDNGKVQFRIATDGRSWQIGVPYYGKRGKVEGYYGFGAAAEVGNFNSEGDGWASMPINGDQVNAFRGNPSFSIDLDRGEQTFDLRGAAGAIDKARECAKNRGQQVAAAPPKPAGGKGCPAPGAVRSQNSNRPLEISFFNASKVPLTIYWVDYDGSWKKYHTLAPNTHVEQKTFMTHPWLAVDAKGNCHGGVMMPDPKNESEGVNQFQIWD